MNIKSIKLNVASPDVIRSWSSGEITKQETINYRTQKPEDGGLFCERIFGPVKDWECACGKYKKIRYKGVVCDKCGVEVTRSVVRRSRMGHISLVTPVTHVWFVRGLPSKIGLLLDLSIPNLERIIYFVSFVITKVDEQAKADILVKVKDEYQKKQQIIVTPGNKTDAQKNEELNELTQAYTTAVQELHEIKQSAMISENKYRELSLKYGHVFTAGIGAEAILSILKSIDLEATIQQLTGELKDVAASKKEKYIKRIKLLKSLYVNKIKPEWLVITVLPIIPADLRPMIALEGGRFAASDLNDLYRLVLNRNNRLKQLIALRAPEIICRNEKRMLQEAVDSLIDNSARTEKTKITSAGQKRPLKSLANALRGKQGRFRQNLLGKRIDYSGRSVIVVGPSLKLDQCGIPAVMALELFKPFVIRELIKQEYAHNIRSATRFIEKKGQDVWNILESVTKDAYILLNRAPTLHRLGIQAFKPVLVDGKAIHIHPLVCAGFNADFDGDQMAVYVPLTDEARKEAAEIILSTKNLLKPASGDPIVTPTKDIVWGAHYLTILNDNSGAEVVKHSTFASINEAFVAYELECVALHDLIKVRIEDGSIIETTVGRLHFNSILPESLRYINRVMLKGDLSDIIQKCLNNYSNEVVVIFLDELKNLAFKFLTKSGLSFGIGDMPLVEEKSSLIEVGRNKVAEIDEQYNEGLLTKDERQEKIIEAWTNVKDQVTDASQKAVIKNKGTISSMIESGARGSWGQLTQIIGMKGLVTNPSGKIIELPVLGSFKDGFDVLEYFISTHGTRKGLSDMALKTSNAGYLTRRLVDVAHDVIVDIEDCGDTDGITYATKDLSTNLIDNAVSRVTLDAIESNNVKEKAPLVMAGNLVSNKLGDQLKKISPESIRIRSILSCKSKRGVCGVCYGADLSTGQLVNLGTAVGIIAAQSIGEPGTQLTMRTFHTGGVVELDITHGLSRVEELLEVRSPKNKAIMCDVDGVVLSIDSQDTRMERIVKVVCGKQSDESAQSSKKVKGVKSKSKKTQVVQDGSTTEFSIPPGYKLFVKEGSPVARGDQLTNGRFDLLEISKLKGREFTQKYIISEIQQIYASHGQKLDIKHVEIFVRQMFSKVYIQDPGDAAFLQGEIVDKRKFDDANKEIKNKSGQQGVGDNLLLSITKAALATYSFLSAASFQETSRILINSAVTGREDTLEGLKENVIIGRLIPAGTGFNVRKREG